jgi:4-diphosphocytidyl-2-C-methyl-D-erythritol kinase
VNQRPDGYHNLVTCFYPVPWTDIIEIIPSKEFSFSSSGKNIPGDQSDNLCVKAYQILTRDFKIPSVKIHLHKQIPMGAGLGGGSSDGAHTLKVLNEIFSLGLKEEDLKSYASLLGSDCSFFISNKPQLGTGRGEILTDISLNLSGKYLVLVKPEVNVSTKEAYAGVVPAAPAYSLEKVLVDTPISEWRNVLTNDFEVSVFKRYPQLTDIKTQLYQCGALYASMSGSGSTIFGIFDGISPSIKSYFNDAEVWMGKV